MNVHRGEERLRRHRVSITGATYFITICLRDRTSILTDMRVASTLNAEWRGCEDSGHVEMLASTIMPDHMHVVFRLTGSPSVARVIGRIKSKTRREIEQVGGSWQPNFFEHRFRPEETLGPVVRYIFNNPYRKNLIPIEQAWPWFWCSSEISAWFNPTTDDGGPCPEWLR